jgi:hypothetical protein
MSTKGLLDCVVECCPWRVDLIASTCFCAEHARIIHSLPEREHDCRCACHVAGVPCEMCQVAHVGGDPS